MLTLLLLLFSPFSWGEGTSAGIPPSLHPDFRLYVAEEGSSHGALAKVPLEHFSVDKDRPLKCYADSLSPVSVKWKNPENNCLCEKGRCHLTGLVYPANFSGEINLNVWFEDDDGVGSASNFSIVIPMQTETGTTLILFFGAIILIGISVFLLANVIFTEEDQFQAQEKLEDFDNQQKTGSGPLLLKYSRPFFKRYFSPVVKGMKAYQKRKNADKKNILNAGLSDILTPEDFYSLKLFLILGFPIIFLFVRWFLGNDGEDGWPLGLVPVIAVMGFYYPEIWIKSIKSKRQKSVIEEMPFIVDMLALSVEAGLDTVAAISRVIEKAPSGALKSEFETFLKEIKIGASRSEAFRNLAYRIDMIQMSSFCATLIAADSVGAPIPPILKALSVEIRQKRSSEIEKKGAQAASKILFPMIFFIVPAVLIVVFAPVLLDFVN